MAVISASKFYVFDMFAANYLLQERPDYLWLSDGFAVGIRLPTAPLNDEPLLRVTLQARSLLTALLRPVFCHLTSTRS